MLTNAKKFFRFSQRIQYMNNHKVSVIMPNCNKSKYIKDTIECVLKQTYKNIELLIIDDNSKDNSLDIIKSIKDERIKLFQNTYSEGAAYCRNLGIANATGEYIAFLDSDDLWTNDKIEKQLNFMISNNYEFSCTNYRFMNEDGSLQNKYLTAPKKITHRMFMHYCYCGCLTVMYKKSAYPDLAIPIEIKRRNDYALWIKLSEKVDCYLLDEILSYYRVSTNNSLSSASKFTLLKHHTFLFKALYKYGELRTCFCSFRNGIYYFLRRLRYLKKIKA